jgi:hypothetical protein
MAEFSAADMDKWVESVQGDMDEAVRAVCIDLSTKVILRTPVDKGRARGNWIATIDAPATGTRSQNSPTGRGTITRASRTANRAPGKVFYLTNNLPYINRLEYGYSGQAPQGMVRVTISEFNSIVRRRARRS